MSVWEWKIKWNIFSDEWENSLCHAILISFFSFFYFCFRINSNLGVVTHFIFISTLAPKHNETGKKPLKHIRVGWVEFFSLCRGNFYRLFVNKCKVFLLLSFARFPHTQSCIILSGLLFELTLLVIFGGFGRKILNFCMNLMFKAAPLKREIAKVGEKASIDAQNSCKINE